jgi:Family of unknown function (DUF6292)
VASIRDDTAPGDNPSTSGAVTPLGRVPADPSGAPTDLFHEAIDRHPTDLGRHLDTYLAAVARELQVNGVLIGAPQRSDPAHRLTGSIVLDTTALRLAAWTSQDRTDGTESLGGALHPERPAPVVATWDEDTGWCVGLHHDPTHSSRRYLHPDLLPAARAVAEFVVGLALGQPLGAAHPIASVAAAPGGPTTASRAVTPPPP